MVDLALPGTFSESVRHGFEARITSAPVDDVMGQCFGNISRPGSAKEMEPQKTQMNANVARINDLSSLVIGCALTVANTLGSGFLEKVYENALAYELRKSGLGVVQQGDVVVKYDGVTVGEYATDLLVE